MKRLSRMYNMLCHVFHSAIANCSVGNSNFNVNYGWLIFFFIILLYHKKGFPFRGEILKGKRTILHTYVTGTDKWRTYRQTDGSLYMQDWVVLGPLNLARVYAGRDRENEFLSWAQRMAACLPACPSVCLCVCVYVCPSVSPCVGRHAWQGHLVHRVLNSSCPCFSFLPDRTFHRVGALKVVDWHFWASENLKLKNVFFFPLLLFSSLQAWFSDWKWIGFTAPGSTLTHHAEKPPLKSWLIDGHFLSQFLQLLLRCPLGKQFRQ